LIDSYVANEQYFLCLVNSGDCLIKLASFRHHENIVTTAVNIIVTPPPT